MIVEINSFLTLFVAIMGIAGVPALVSAWAGRLADKNAKRAAHMAESAAIKVTEVKDTLVETSEATKIQLGEIHTLVNNQLSEAVARFDLATQKIAGLEALVKKLQAATKR